MLELAPEDRQAIQAFCRAARGFVKMELPVGKPYELMTIGDKLKFGRMAAKYLPYLRWNRMTMSQAMTRFKSPLLRAGSLSAWPGSFPAGFLLTTMA